jgi:SagB-type dehydrogenase family enzyme
LVGDPRAALDVVAGTNTFVGSAPLTLMMTAALEAPLAKYGVRHYRTLHYDAGVIIQSLYLVSTALGLGACAIAGYVDAEARTLLSCDEDQISMALFSVGYGG